ncbi:pyridoxal phosphate-dependent aminotransferase [bacterium]|nr:MAG: pyridoxal phosphate-dependent aminotransferase [bacterium]
MAELVPARRVRAIEELTIHRVAAAVPDDVEILRLENLDTDLRPWTWALAATRTALLSDAANSYLPFTGSLELRRAVAARLSRQTDHAYDAGQVLITAGGLEGIFDVLLATVDPGDEVIVTDPTYIGLLNRVRLAGAVPVPVPLRVRAGEWRLDCAALRAAVTDKTKACLMMSPSMPSGAVFDEGEWEAVAALCREHDLWLIDDAAMERILFDRRALVHPASLPGMAERTIVVGSVSKEQRMIGWRVGWIAAPPALVHALEAVRMANVVTPVGIAQGAAVAALEAPAQEYADVLAEWERRRDAVLEQLEGYAPVRPAGGWSLLIDATPLGLDGAGMARQLLERGKVAVAPMAGWGTLSGDRYVRLVFSNEPLERLALLGERMRRAFG